MRGEYFLDSDVLSIADLQTRWPGITDDKIEDIIFGQYITPYLNVAKEISPDGDRLCLCESIADDQGFGTTISISSNWKKIVFRFHDVEYFEHERPDFKCNHIIKLHNLDGHSEESEACYKQFDSVDTCNNTNDEKQNENIEIDNNRQKSTVKTRSVITIRDDVFNWNTPQKVRDAMRTAGYKDAVIAYVLYKFMNENLTAIGRHLKGRQKDGLDLADSTYLRHAHKLLAEAASLQIVRG